MALPIKDFQQNLIAPSAEPPVFSGEVPPNLMGARRLQAKSLESKRLFGIVTYLTPHKKAQFMSGCQLRTDRRPSAHLAGDGKGKEGRTTEEGPAL